MNWGKAPQSVEEKKKGGNTKWWIGFLWCTHTQLSTQWGEKKRKTHKKTKQKWRLKSRSFTTQPRPRPCLFMQNSSNKESSRLCVSSFHSLYIPPPPFFFLLCLLQHSPPLLSLNQLEFQSAWHAALQSVEYAPIHTVYTWARRTGILLVYLLSYKDHLCRQLSKRSGPIGTHGNLAQTLSQIPKYIRSDRECQSDSFTVPAFQTAS